MAKIPESIDKYRLESLIASGGMGQVYKGIHPTLDRPVILKKLTLRGNAAITERFRREARILMDFRSDHIVDVYDHFKKGANHYIVMEYVDGISVQGLLLKERYFDNATCAYIALRTAKALAYAHKKEVIHRDIKPDNVLISKEGDVKLADFGIAATRDADDPNLTHEGMTLGTPSYMAPEQFEDSRTVDGRADLYSLGVMLYEMLTGGKPYPGRFSPELVKAIQKGKYKKPRRINSGIAPELQRVVIMLMKPNLHRRCSDAGEVIRRLKRYLSRYDEASVEKRLACLAAEAEPVSLRLRKRKRTARWLLAGIAAAMIAGAGGAHLSLTSAHRRILDPSGYGQVRFIVEGFPGEVDAEDLRVSVAGTGSNEEFSREVIVRNVPYIRRLSRDAASVIITSFPINLSKGDYRAEAQIGNREIIALFTVKPWKTARRESVISLPLVETGAREIQIIAEIVDSDKGIDLTGVAIIEVMRGNRYVPMEDAEALMSGRVYTFKIRAAGYKAKVIVVPVSIETDGVTITVEMVASGG
jgi:eukaryotic-like serine/threonine-protein kinase